MYKICVTNRHLVQEDFLSRIKKIVETDVSAVILREKDMREDEYYKIAQAVMKICKNAGVECILHKFVYTAKKLNAQSIHLPFQDFMQMNKDEMQEFDKIGTSVHSIEDAIAAEKKGASYVTAGHIFVTDCKKGLEPRGLDFLKSVCESVSIPVYAIGGINISNARQCIESGAMGICMMSDYMQEKRIN